MVMLNANYHMHHTVGFRHMQVGEVDASTATLCKDDARECVTTMRLGCSLLQVHERMLRHGNPNEC